MPKPYKRVTHYHFEVGDHNLAIVDKSKDFLTIEEVDKNGQEDTHMIGVLVATEAGSFVWESGKNMFDEYGYEGLSDEIREYINTHGIPGMRG